MAVLLNKNFLWIILFFFFFFLLRMVAQAFATRGKLSWITNINLLLFSFSSAVSASKRWSKTRTSSSSYRIPDAENVKNKLLRFNKITAKHLWLQSHSYFWWPMPILKKSYADMLKVSTICVPIASMHVCLGDCKCALLYICIYILSIHNI